MDNKINYSSVWNYLLLKTEMLKSILNNERFENVVRSLLLGILVILPFQYIIVENVRLLNAGLSVFIGQVDELVILILLPVAIIKLLDSKNKWIYILLLLHLILIGGAGFLSGSINVNPLKVTILGSFSYIKYFFAIFIYAAFFREYKDFNRTIQFLLIGIVIIGAVAFFQELWAIGARYLFGAKLTAAGTSFLHTPEYLQGQWRIGIYRVRSVLSHPNTLGLYSLMILTFYLYSVRKKKLTILFFIFAGIIFSVSRTVFTGLLFLTAMQLFRKMRLRKIMVLVPVLCLAFYLIALPHFNTVDLNKSGELRFSEGVGMSFREYAMEKGLQVWKDNPIWGAGPGMFGSPIASKYNSYLYEVYNVSLIEKWFKSLDQFWPQLLAEMGFVGTMLFAGLFVLLFIIYLISWEQTESDEIKKLFAGLSVFLVIIIIYSFSSNLKFGPLFFTYSAFTGMGLGCVYEK